MNTPTPTPHPLLEHVGILRTRMGAAYPGERAVFRGVDLHRDLAGIGWIDLACFGATGRRLPAAQLQLIEAIFVGTNYPDARIWNNRVAALGGTARSTPCLSVSAGNVISEALIYGRRNEFRAMRFLQDVVAEVQAGAALDDCVDRYLAARGYLPGYGRPIAMRDERIEPALKLARELGLDSGPHVTTALAIERLMQGRGKPLQMNVGAFGAAITSDFGFAPREFNLLCFALFTIGMGPCYLEAVDQPAGASFPVPCAQVHYEGPAPRDWPGAGAD